MIHSVILILIFAAVLCRLLARSLFVLCLLSFSVLVSLRQKKSQQDLCPKITIKTFVIIFVIIIIITIIIIVDIIMSASTLISMVPRDSNLNFFEVRRMLTVSTVA